MDSLFASSLQQEDVLAVASRLQQEEVLAVIVQKIDGLLLTNPDMSLDDVIDFVYDQHSDDDQLILRVRNHFDTVDPPTVRDKGNRPEKGPSEYWHDTKQIMGKTSAVEAIKFLSRSFQGCPPLDLLYYLYISNGNVDAVRGIIAREEPEASSNEPEASSNDDNATPSGNDDNATPSGDVDNATPSGNDDNATPSGDDNGASPSASGIDDDASPSGIFFDDTCTEPLILEPKLKKIVMDQAHSNGGIRRFNWFASLAMVLLVILYFWPQLYIWQNEEIEYYVKSTLFGILCCVFGMMISLKESVFGVSKAKKKRKKKRAKKKHKKEFVLPLSHELSRATIVPTGQMPAEVVNYQNGSGVVKGRPLMLWAAETLPRLDGLFTPQKLLTRINIIMKCIDEQRLARSKSLVIPYLTENGSEVDATREPIAYPLDQTAHFLRGLRDFQVMLHERIQAEADGIDEETTKRELAYQLVDILGEKGVSELMALIARHLGIPYRSMRIAAEQIGAIAGRLWVRFGNEFVDCTKLLLQPGGIATFAMLGNIILGASQPKHQLQFYTDAQLVLVVGDGGIFQRIVRARLFDKIPMIIICSHGNMRYDTNVNLFCISKAFGIPVYVLDDADWGGLKLTNTPFYSKNRLKWCQYEGGFCGIETNLLGILAQQFEVLEINNQHIEKLKMDDDYMEKIRNYVHGGSYGFDQHGNVVEKLQHVKLLLEDGHCRMMEGPQKKVFMSELTRILAEVVEKSKADQPQLPNASPVSLPAAIDEEVPSADDDIEAARQSNTINAEVAGAGTTDEEIARRLSRELNGSSRIAAQRRIGAVVSGSKRSRSSLAEQIDTLTSERDDAVKQRDNAVEELDSVQGRLTTRTTERDNAVEERNTVQGDLETLRTERDNAVEQLEAAIDNLHEAEARLEISQNENEELLDQVSELEREINSLRDSEETIEAKAVDLEVERDEFRRKLEEQEEEVNALQTSNDELAARVSDLKRMNMSLQQKRLALAESNTSLQTTNTNLAAQVNDLEGERADLQNERGALRDTLEQRESELNVANLDVATLSEAVNIMHDQQQQQPPDFPHPPPQGPPDFPPPPQGPHPNYPPPPQGPHPNYPPPPY